MEKLIEKARRLAYDSHRLQRRKNYNLPYIVHIERVVAYVNAQLDMDASLLECGDDYDHIIAAAYGHDLKEDCDVTDEALRNNGFSEFSIELINSLTKSRERMNREEKNKIYNETLAKSHTYAKIIKLADRYDNLNDFAVSFVRKRIESGRYLMYLDETEELLKHIYVKCSLFNQLSSLRFDLKQSYMDDKNKIIATKFAERSLSPNRRCNG